MFQGHSSLNPVLELRRFVKIDRGVIRSASHYLHEPRPRDLLVCTRLYLLLLRSRQRHFHAQQFHAQRNPRTDSRLGHPRLLQQLLDRCVRGAHNRTCLEERKKAKPYRLAQVQCSCANRLQGSFCRMVERGLLRRKRQQAEQRLLNRHAEHVGVYIARVEGCAQQCGIPRISISRLLVRKSNARQQLSTQRPGRVPSSIRTCPRG